MPSKTFGFTRPESGTAFVARGELAGFAASGTADGSERNVSIPNSVDAWSHASSRRRPCPSNSTRRRLNSVHRPLFFSHQLNSSVILPAISSPSDPNSSPPSPRHHGQRPPPPGPAQTPEPGDRAPHSTVPDQAMTPHAQQPRHTICIHPSLGPPSLHTKLTNKKTLVRKPNNNTSASTVSTPNLP